MFPNPRELTLLVVLQLPRNVQRVMRYERERRMRIGLVAQLLQLEHVQSTIQRRFGSFILG